MKRSRGGRAYVATKSRTYIPKDHGSTALAAIFGLLPHPIEGARVVSLEKDEDENVDSQNLHAVRRGA